MKQSDRSLDRPRSGPPLQPRPGRLAVAFEPTPQNLAKIRGVAGSHWHEDKSCWSVPDTAPARDQLKRLFRGETLRVAPRPHWVVPPAPKGPTAEPSGSHPAPTAVSGRGGSPSSPNPRAGHLETAAAADSLGPDRAHHRELVRRELQLRGYSAQTRKVYLHHVMRFLEHAGKPAEALSTEDIRSYLMDQIDRHGVSRSFHSQAVSAIKFLFDHVLLKPGIADSIPRPRKEKKLPSVLSRSEIRRLFDAVENSKHRAILMLVYSAGLRVGEVIRLRVEDINAERRLIH